MRRRSPMKPSRPSQTPAKEFSRSARRGQIARKRRRKSLKRLKSRPEMARRGIGRSAANPSSARPSSPGLQTAQCPGYAERDGGVLMFSDLVSARLSPTLEPLRPPPVFQQRPPALGRALVEDGDRSHPVEAEVAERLPRLASGGEHHDLVEEADRDRPDDAVRRPPLPVGIGEGEFPLAGERLAHDGQRRALGLPRPASAREQGRPVERWGALGRQHGADLGERVARARARPASARPSTQRAPSASASISSRLNISGGSANPGFST